MSADTGMQGFRLDEAAIDQLHQAIQAGETACVGAVRRYIVCVRACNGLTSILVTEDALLRVAPACEAASRRRIPLPE